MGIENIAGGEFKPIVVEGLDGLAATSVKICDTIYGSSGIRDIMQFFQYDHDDGTLIAMVGVHFIYGKKNHVQSHVEFYGESPDPEKKALLESYANNQAEDFKREYALLVVNQPGRPKQLSQVN